MRTEEEGICSIQTKHDRETAYERHRHANVASATDGKCLFASIMIGLFLLSYQCTAVLGASTYHHVRLQYPSTWNFLLYS